MCCGRLHAGFPAEAGCIIWSRSWPVGCAGELRTLLSGPGSRSAGRFAERMGMRYAEFPADPIDLFANVNTPEDLARVRSGDIPA